MEAPLRLALAALLGAAGCTDSMGEPLPGDPGHKDDSPGDTEPDPPPTEEVPDYTGARWRSVNVSSSTGTISHHAQIAFRGTSPMVAFSEPDPEDLSDQDIHTATTDGLIWTDEPRTDSRDQLAFPSLVGAGDSMLLAYNGPDADDNRSLFVMEWTPEGWDGAAELDPADPDAPPRQHGEPSLVAAAAGPTALYFAWEGTPGTLAETVEVRAQLVGGEPQVVTAADTGLCSNLRAVTGADGAIHAIARCGGFLYFTDAGGDWSVTYVPLGVSSPPSRADIAVDPSGSVHIAWAGRTDCGDRACSRIFYSRDLGNPVMVAAGEDGEGFYPAIGADPDGVPVIAYHRHHDGTTDVLLTHSADGGSSFAEPAYLTADSPDRNTSPEQLVFGPDGRPHLLFQRIVAGSEPLDGEVMHATID